MLLKTLGWEDRLAQYLLDCTQLAFVWGMHDCALFAAGAVQAMTGHDLGAIFRGQYNDALGAERALRNYLKVHHVALRQEDSALEMVIWDLLYVVHDCEKIKQSGFISRGDIIVIDVPETGIAIGVCDGVNMLAVRVEGGLTNLPREAVRYGWRLP